MAEWKNEVLNWAEEHSDGQIELKGWRAVFRDYLEKYDDDEEGIKQFLTEDESFEIMAGDYMEATGNSLYDRDGNLISDVILDYWKAHICPVCNKKLKTISEEEWSRGTSLHRDCVKEFESQPEKYIRKAEAPSNSEPSDKDFVTTLLLCIFLGGLGVHRFFVDKMGTGALMLVTFGGLGIWWIIDIILIVTSSFEDSEGRVIAYQPAGTANREPVKDIPAEIRKFAELKKDGLISEEEFDKKKEELL